jgi:PAS domain S-box-containing protein
MPVEVEDYYPPHQRWYRFRAFPSREGLAFYGQDVTAQRRLQEDLERQRVLLETIIESAPDPIFAKDREGRCITLNSAAARVHGCARDAVIGLADADVFSPEVTAAMRDQERRIMETGATEVIEETIPDRHHGKPRVFLTTKTPRQGGGRAGQPCKVEVPRRGQPRPAPAPSVPDPVCRRAQGLRTGSKRRAGAEATGAWVGRTEGTVG